MRERHIPLERVFNFRDLGGYPAAGGRTVRSRRVFRSGQLHWATETDVTALRDDIGVRTVIDLRSVAEVEQYGIGPVADGWAEHRHVVLIEEVVGDFRRELEAAVAGLAPAPALAAGERIWTQHYIELFEGGGEGVASALRLVADSDHGPTVFHCAAGKDRTGVVAAALLGALGVDDETIIEDFALTGAHMPGFAEMLIEVDGEPEALRTSPALLAMPGAMRAALGTLRERYGSTRGYLEAAGTDAAVLDRLVEVMVE